MKRHNGVKQRDELLRPETCHDGTRGLALNWKWHNVLEIKVLGMFLRRG